MHFQPDLGTAGLKWGGFTFLPYDGWKLQLNWGRLRKEGLIWGSNQPRPDFSHFSGGLRQRAGAVWEGEAGGIQPVRDTEGWPDVCAGSRRTVGTHQTSVWQNQVHRVHFHSDGSVGTVLGTEEETEAGTHLEAMRQAWWRQRLCGIRSVTEDVKARPQMQGVDKGEGAVVSQRCPEAWGEHCCRRGAHWSRLTPEPGVEVIPCVCIPGGPGKAGRRQAWKVVPASCQKGQSPYREHCQGHRAAVLWVSGVWLWVGTGISGLFPKVIDYMGSVTTIGREKKPVTYCVK